MCYQEMEFYSKEVSFDNPNIEYKIFKDIETLKIYTGYIDKYIEEECKHHIGKQMTPSSFVILDMVDI